MTNLYSRMRPSHGRHRRCGEQNSFHRYTEREAIRPCRCSYSEVAGRAGQSLVQILLVGQIVGERPNVELLLGSRPSETAIEQAMCSLGQAIVRLKVKSTRVRVRHGRIQISPGETRRVVRGQVQIVLRCLVQPVPLRAPRGDVVAEGKD